MPARDVERKSRPRIERQRRVMMKAMSGVAAKMPPPLSDECFRATQRRACSRHCVKRDDEMKSHEAEIDKAECALRPSVSEREFENAFIAPACRES